MGRERIPTLAEVLATIPAGKKLFVEIKVDAGILTELNRVLKNHQARLSRWCSSAWICIRWKSSRNPSRYHVYWVCSLKDEKKRAAKGNPGEGLIAVRVKRVLMAWT